MSTATASRIVPDGELATFRVSRERPCPCCGKPDWCLSDGENWAICQRVESDQRWGEAGWFHRLNERVNCAPLRRPTQPVQRRRQRQERGVVTATYTYHDEHGEPLYRKQRIEFKTKPKITPFERFDATRGSGPDDPRCWVGGKGCMDGVRRVLYRLPWLLSRQRVFVVEGEKCADALWDFGLMGTTADAGAGNWMLEYSQMLAGKDCILIPDNDDKGREHMLKVAVELHDTARSVKLLVLPDLGPKDDVHDFLMQGADAL